MIPHEEARKILALAAAGELSAEEQRAVEQHTRGCEECRRELEVLGMYALGLREMPQPAVPEGLLERTRIRVAEAGWVSAEQRLRDVLLGVLVALSWAVGAGLWLVAREVTGGGMSALGVSTLLVWTTAGAAAVLLRKKDWLARRMR